MRLFARSLVFVAAFSVAASSAYAATIDFSSGTYTPTNPPLTGNTFTSYTQSGFTINDDTGGWVYNAGRGDPAPGLSAGAFNNSSGVSDSFTLSCTATCASGFVIDSFDLATWGNNETVTVSYDLVGGGTASFTTPTENTGTSGTQVNTTIDLPTEDALSAIFTINDVGGVAFGNATFDTININTPEPNSLILLGTGLIGLGAFARRRFAL